MKSKIFLLLVLPSIFFIFMLGIRAAHAELTVIGPKQNQYNLGDAAEVDGFISSSSSADGFLKTVLLCSAGSRNSTFPVQTTSMSIVGGQSKVFTEKFIIPRMPESICSVNLIFEVNGSATESGTSRSFLVTDALKGNFGISKNEIQLGEKLLITGRITKVSGSSAEPVVTVYLRRDDSDYLITTLNTNGNFTYSYDSKGNPAGNYSVDFFASDKFGNQYLFKDALKFRVSNLIIVTVSTEKVEYLPDSKIKISGTADAELKTSIEGAKVTISIDGFPFLTTVQNNKFVHEFTLKKNAKSGKHDITVEVVDAFGNKGSALSEFIVTPVATNLSAQINPSSLLPKESFEITPMLLDQGGAAMSKLSNVKVYNPSNVKVFESDVITGNSAKYSVPEFAAPGSYRVEVSSEGLAWKGMLQVDTQEELNYALEGGAVIVQNKGNILFKEVITIALSSDSKNYTVKVKLALAPNESAKIDLSKEVPAGNYTVSVSSRLASQDLGMASISDNRPLLKKGVSSVSGLAVSDVSGISIMNLFYLLLFGAALGVAGALIMKKRNAPKISKEEETHANEFNEYLKQKREASVKHSEENEEIKKIRSDPEIVNFLDRVFKK